MKMASRVIELVSTNVDQRSFNTTVIARIVNTTTYAEADEYVQAYLNMNTSKCWTPDLLTSLKIPRSVPRETTMDELSIEKDKEEASCLFYFPLLSKTFYFSRRYFKKGT